MHDRTRSHRVVWVLNKSKEKNAERKKGGERYILSGGRDNQKRRTKDFLVPLGMGLGHNEGRGAKG